MNNNIKGLAIDNNSLDIKQLLNLFYPIGSIYITVNTLNPSTLFGGTWVRWGNGRVPVGVDTSQSEFNTAEKTGGEKTHKLSEEEMPSHSHIQRYVSSYGYQTYLVSNNGGGYQDDEGYYPPSSASTVGSGKYRTATADNGGDQPHNNLQPYITCYMWKRTA